MKPIIIAIFAIAFTHMVYGQMVNRVDSLEVKDLNAKKLTVESTTSASKPCPAMTEAQRDAISSPSQGQCVFNTTSKKLNVFDSLAWGEVGSASGGISAWETATLYVAGSVVIQESKIYQANADHTSTTFLSDIDNWDLISGVVLDEATGTLDSLLVSTGAGDGAVAYSDGDAFSFVDGSPGQVLQSNGLFAPTFVEKSIRARAETGSTQTMEELLVKNKQLTQTDVNIHLVETNNKNIIANPSFEHYVTGYAWSCSTTQSSDLSVIVDGKKSMKMTLSSQTLNCSQDSSLYAAQFADGVQGLASAFVKTSVPGVKLCARSAGVTSTTLCATHPGDGKWALLKVPFVLGGTTNGLAIVTDSSVTGDVYIDDAFLGANDLKQESSVVGDKTSFTPTSNWPVTFSATYKRIGDTADIEIKGTLTGTPTGQLIVTLPSILTFISDDRGSTSGVINSSAFIGGSIIGGSAYLSGTNAISVRSWGTGGSYLNHVDTSPTIPGSWTTGTQFFISIKNLKIQGWASGDSIYSSSCGANCVDVFSAKVSSTGVVSEENIDWINGNCSSGGTGFKVCSFNTGVFTTAPNCQMVSGVSSTSNFLTRINVSSSSSVTFLTMNTSGTPVDGPFEIMCQKAGVDFTATRTIVGSFKDIPSLVENYVSGDAWYRKWSNGWVEQGNFFNTASGANTATLLVPLINTNYTVQMTSNSPGVAGHVWAANVYSKGTTTFTFYVDAAVNDQAWVVYGYWK